MGQNVTVGLAKNVWTECSAVTFRPKKIFKTKCSGVDEQSVHLEIKCHSGRSEQLDIVLGGRSEGVETLLGRSSVDVSSRHHGDHWVEDQHHPPHFLRVHQLEPKRAAYRLAYCTQESVFYRLAYCTEESVFFFQMVWKGNAIHPAPVPLVSPPSTPPSPCRPAAPSTRTSLLPGPWVLLA